MPRNHQIKVDPLERSYRNHCAILSQTRLKITIILAIALITTFGILDLIVYPKVAQELIKTRAAATIILATVFIALRKKHYPNINLIGIAVVILIFVLINVLIFLTDGMSSPYYAGLILALVAFSAMLPWQAYETLFSFAVMLCSYIATSILHSHINNSIYDLPPLINNLFFLVSVGIFCIVATYLNSKLRFREFSLNYNLDSRLKEETIKLQVTQAQLIQSEKMNAIGNLSAGILHEINNPLNYTMTAVQIIKMDDKVNNDADLKDTFLDIEEGMSRIKNIVSDLHNFAYPEQADQKTQFSILSAVESAIRFTSSECSDMEVVKNINPELLVSAARTHIVQVLVNLITNACKAIVKSGKDGVITFNAEQKDDRVNISVSDNGIGMNEETLKKVFDPFFTTSEVGQGMGMGLSVSYTIIKNHGGILFATSKLGKGSVFSFDLST